MTDATQDVKMAIAKRSSEMIITTLDAAGVPADAQLEAVFMALGALIVRNVKPELAMSLYNAGSAKLRDRIKEALKVMKEKANAGK